MKKEQLAGHEPSFPCETPTSHKGLTKREYVAIEVFKQFMITQDLKAYNCLSMSEGKPWVEGHVIPQCFLIADAIINYDK